MSKKIQENNHSTLYKRQNVCYYKNEIRQNVCFRKKGAFMLITKSISEKVRAKRGKEDLTKCRVAILLGVSRTTLAKIEKGNYDAPKRIYESVMNWLIEDL